MSLFDIKNKIRRFFNKIFKTQRPSSYPFISGDSFRSLAQHICDEHFDISPENVSKNDIVFVRGSFLHYFFTNIHPKIKNGYILISHNDDTNVDEFYKKFIDDKIIHWFAENLAFKHPKITPVPIGIENLYLNKNGKLKYFQQENYIKENDVIIKYGFNIKSNIERISAFENLQKSNCAEKIDTKDQDEYIDLIKKSYYVASPTGAGLDCHRTWESMYLQTIPIVKKNFMNEYFKNLGLPIYIINDWEDLKYLNKTNLKKDYDNIYKTNLFPPLFMDYWMREINKYKK